MNEVKDMQINKPVDPELLKQIRNLRNGRNERESLFLDSYRKFMRPMLNDDATWNIELTKEFGRLDLQMCTAFYMGNEDDIRIANLMTCRAPLSSMNNIRFGIFGTSIICQLYIEFRDKMTSETRDYCEKAILEGCCNTPSMRDADLQFHGYNDNMPAMAVKTLVLAGEKFNHPELIVCGKWKLERFAEQLSRCGLISEYNSPNYTADTLHNIMALVKYSRDPEVVEMARKIVKRIWLDLVVHWHPTGHCQAGPFSRAYEHDFNNNLSVWNGVVWLLFGPDISRYSMLETISPREGMYVMHNNNKLEHSTRMAWYSIIDDSLLDDETATLMLSKDFPYEVIASTENGHHQGGALKKMTATTYMEQDFTLGSASFPFCNGSQTASVYASGSDGDNSTVMYLRYLVDDEYPGVMNEGYWHNQTFGPSEINSYAAPVTVQQQKTVICSYTPVQTLAGKELKQLRMALIVPNSQNNFAGFIDGNGKALEVDKEYNDSQWYGAVLGNSIAAFYPLAYSVDAPGKTTVIPRRNDLYDYLEIVNYNTAGRCFNEAELTMIMNGGVLEMASLDDWENPAEFIKEISKETTIEDFYMANSRRVRYLRQPVKDRAELMMTLSHSPAYDGSAVRTVNNQYAPEVPWKCTGLPAGKLPLMNGDKVLAVPGIPWDNMGVFQFPDLKWHINHSGKKEMV